MLRVPRTTPRLGDLLEGIKVNVVLTAKVYCSDMVRTHSGIDPSLSLSDPSVLTRLLSPLEHSLYQRGDENERGRGRAVSLHLHLRKTELLLDRHVKGRCPASPG